MKKLRRTATSSLRRALVLTALCAVAGATEAQAATLVVDRDRAQCAKAGFTSIQAAVQAASAGDVIRVCPDLYSETVTVDRSVTIKGEPDAVEAVDCFGAAASQPGDADPTQQAIIEGAGSSAQELFDLRADKIVVAGFVLQGAASDPRPSDYRLYRRAINTSDQYSGYRIHHNLIRLNTVGIQFGSSGAHKSRFHENCLRDNAWGLATDDRALVNARVDHNATFRTQFISFEPLLGDVEHVTFDHNQSRQDGFHAYWIRNSTASAIVDNHVAGSGVNAINIAGAHAGLRVNRNDLDGARNAGILMTADVTSRDGEIVANVITGTGASSIAIQGANERLRIVGNDVRGGGSAGILAPAAAAPRDPWATLTDSVVTGNTVLGKAGTGISLNGGTGNVVSRNLSSGNGSTGIFLGPSFTDSHVSDNVAHDNGRHGIAAAPGATGHRIERNWMTANGSVNPAMFFDASDANPWPSNLWIDNTCVRDNLGGAICGVG